MLMFESYRFLMIKEWKCQWRNSEFLSNNRFQTFLIDKYVIYAYENVTEVKLLDREES